MAIRNIIQLGDPTLRKKSFEVTDFGPKTMQLIDDMKQTLALSGGVGLAAPQVGVLRRIIIVSFEDFYAECINPVILSQSGKAIECEGCLSVKGKSGDVVRPNKITVKYQDRTGKEHKIAVEGYLARIFCHECDHLDGIVFIDKAINIQEEGK